MPRIETLPETLTDAKMGFPIDLSAFKPVALDPAHAELAPEQREQLQRNIQLCRDAIVFFTAVGDAKGVGGHTGGPYDIVPEVLIADGFMRGSDRVLPIYFDEAGHRVAIQYLMAVLNGELEAERLLHYREAGSRLPGHPERDFTPGVKFSSGRLGHLWPYVNGVALANPDRAIFVFGSDGAQQEGNDAEAARMAVAQGLNVKLVIDDNDVTIAGHPSRYLPGFDVARTLEGHGLQVDVGQGEDLDALYRRMQKALGTPGPVALINKRTMAVGIDGLEGSNKAHDVIKTALALEYLKAHGRPDAVAYLEAVQKPKDPAVYLGSSSEQAKNRDLFGKIVCGILEGMTPEERKARVLAIDSDLEGSCGMHHIGKAFPEIYINGGVMERGNFSAAAGFGMEAGKQGIFATFSAFLEMVVSEITMARLNESNVLCHFSHAGVDWMADNTCHYGLNNFFAAGGLADGDHTRLYFPADRHQMKACIERIFWDPGLRFVFSTRSGTPEILKQDGTPFYGEGCTFEPGRDDFVREGSAGYVVSYGEMLYRALDAVERLRAGGLDVGLVNKATLNVVDEDALARLGAAPFVLLAETQNRNTGLGSRLGTWLLERGLTPRYAHLGSTKQGDGGLWEHIANQGLDSESIQAAVRKLAG
ncbi:MAG: transketolase [Planctomycetota bacterium]|nr:transketolase [Planctomycetota bacterium]